MKVVLLAFLQNSEWYNHILAFRHSKLKLCFGKEEEMLSITLQCHVSRMSTARVPWISSVPTSRGFAAMIASSHMVTAVGPWLSDMREVAEWRVP